MKISRHNLQMALLAVAVLTLLWLLFFWRILLASPSDRQTFPIGDFTQHYYAFSEYQVERLHRGEFPLWNPYNHAGDPFAGNIQFVAFYPPRLLAALLADDWSVAHYQREIAAHYWLASVMMLAFLWVLVKRPAIALVGSLLYTYSGYLTGYPMLQVSVLESVVWLPLVMLGVHLSVHRRGWALGGVLLAAAGLALSLLGGHPQTSMHIGYTATAYLIYTGWRTGLDWRGILVRLGLFGVIAAGLAAVQLLPAAEFTRLSYRLVALGYEDKANGFTGAEFLQVLWPTLFGVWSPLYIGVVGFMLLFGALLRPTRYRLFWFGVIAVCLFLSLGGNNIVYDAFYLVVPGFNTFRQQERVAALMSFAAVVLATQQLVSLFDPEQRHTTSATSYRRIVFLAAAFFVAAYVVATMVSILADQVSTSFNGVFGLVAVVAGLFAFWLNRFLRHPLPRWPWVIPLILLIVVDLFTVGTRSDNFIADIPENRPRLPESLQEYANIPPQEIRWRVDGAAGVRGDGVLFGVPDIYGTGPFKLETIELLRQIPVERFWEVLAVRYATITDEPPESVPLELLAYDQDMDGTEFRVFELQDPRPLAYLVYDAIDAQGSREFARQIMSDPRVNLRETAVVLQPLPLELSGERPETSKVTDFDIITPEHIEMTVSTAADALLTLSFVNYPGWHASIDGERVDIVDTYAGLIGVPMRAGEDQHVELRFQPESVRYGLIVTIVSAIITLLLIAFGPMLEQRIRWLWIAERPTEAQT